MEKGAPDHLFEALSAASCCREQKTENFELRPESRKHRTASEIALADFGPNLIWLRWRAFMEQIYNNFQISLDKNNNTSQIRDRKLPKGY